MDVDERNRQGRTKLHRACIAGSSQRVKELLANNATVDLEDSRGDTGLNMAARTGAFVVMKLLIDAKADTNHQDKYGSSGLHLACREGNVECVRLLVESKADVFLQDEDGRTALDLAVVYCGQRNVPLTLFDLVLGAIEAAADPYNLRPTILSAPITKWLRTGDLSARTGRHDRMFLALVYAGAIVTPKEFEELSEAGQTLLAEYDDRVARTLRACEPRHNSLYTTLYRDVEVDTRIGLCAMGLYDEPLERVMEYVGFRIHGRPFVSTGHRGAPEITQHALNDGNGNWRHLEEYTEQRR